MKFGFYFVLINKIFIASIIYFVQQLEISILKVKEILKVKKDYETWANRLLTFE